MNKEQYQEAEAYILELPKYTRKNTMEHTRTFLSFLGNPQDGKKCSTWREQMEKVLSACIWMQCFGRGETDRSIRFSAFRPDE